MHILDRSGRELDDSIRRDVTNVRDPVAGGTGLADSSVIDSTGKSWWTSMGSADSRRSGGLAV